MSDFRHDRDVDYRRGRGSSETELVREPNPRRTDARCRSGRSGILFRALATGLGTGALLAGLAIPAAASGSPNAWEGAQVGLTYPVYQPKTVLALPQTSFKLLPCQAGQDESVFATFGTAYTPISNYGKTVGFSIAEGYPFIFANPGAAKQVGVWTVGIPNGTVKVRV